MARLLILITLLVMTSPAWALTANLTWTPSSSTDLAGNTIYRMLGDCALQGPLQPIASVGKVAVYSDTTVPPGTLGAHYDVAAFDTSGNLSLHSNRVCKAYMAAPPVVMSKTLTDAQGTWELFSDHTVTLNGMDLTTNGADLRLCQAVVQIQGVSDGTWWTFGVTEGWRPVAAVCPVVPPPIPAPPLTVTKVERDRVVIQYEWDPVLGKPRECVRISVGHTYVPGSTKQRRQVTVTCVP